MRSSFIVLQVAVRLRTVLTYSDRIVHFVCRDLGPFSAFIQPICESKLYDELPW